MSENSSSKTIPATPLKRLQARQQGNVPQSRSLVTGAILLSVALLLSLNSSAALQEFKTSWTTQLQFRAELDTIDRVSEHTTHAGWLILQQAAPLAIAIFTVAVLSSVLQTGVLLRPTNIQPAVSRLSPGRWWKQVKQPEHFIEHFGGLLRAAIVISIVLGSLWDQRELLTRISLADVSTMQQSSVGLVTQIILRVAVVLFALAILDYGWQRWKWTKSLRMTPAELKEEQRSQNAAQPFRRTQSTRLTDSANWQRDLALTDCLVYAANGPLIALCYNQSTMDVPVIQRIWTRGETAAQQALDIIQQARQKGITVCRQDQLAIRIAESTTSKQKLPPLFYDFVAPLLQQSK